MWTQVHTDFKLLSSALRQTVNDMSAENNAAFVRNALIGTIGEDAYLSRVNEFLAQSTHLEDKSLEWRDLESALVVLGSFCCCHELIPAMKKNNVIHNVIALLDHYRVDDGSVSTPLFMVTLDVLS